VIFQRLREGDMACNGESDNITKDGRTIRCSWLNTPLQSPDGSFSGTMSMVQDITEKAREEEQLRASEANYREIFDSLSDCIFVHDLKTGAILHVNNSVEDLYGYTRDEMYRMNVGVVSMGEPPFTQSEAEEKIRLAREQGPQVFEWLSRSRDGKLVWVEVHLARVKLVGEDRILAIVRNVDKRKREQLALAESEKIKSQIIANTQNAFFAFDSNLVVKEWNRKAEELFGYMANKALGAPIASLIVPTANRDSFEELLFEYVKNQDQATTGKLSKLTAQNKKEEELPLKIHVFTAQAENTILFCMIVANTAILLRE
ncbi:MAG: PAS domain S-box protein, partial [Candidatus Melainabacteria bacterium]|nr:PAS domain S-box protein [Candidatus Melainabacteria bacterium]